MNASKYAAKTQQALLYFQQGQSKNALTILEKICPKDKKNDLAWFLLASIYFKQGQLQKAEAGYQNAINARSNYAEAWNNLGVVRERLGKATEAAKAYTNALKINPDYTSAHFQLGNLLQQSEQHQQAAQHFETVLKLNPDHLNTLINYALGLARHRDYERALELLHRALSIAPNDIEAINNVGYVLRAQGKLDEAIHYFSRAVELQEDCARSLINLGVSQLDAGNIDQAIKLFTQATQHDPANAEAICNLGECYERKAEYDLALRHYEKASRINANYLPAWNAQGALLKKLGRSTEAQEIFSRANEIDPTYSDTRYNLAVTQLGLGQFASGFSNYASRPSRLSLDIACSTLPLENDLQGKKVFINKDQGIGDEIFFLRFAPQLKHRGAKIIYCASQKIATLLQHGAAINELIIEGESIPPHDISLSVGDLPLVLGIDDVTPLPPPLQLKSEQSLIEEMRQTLASFGPPPYIGLTWRGGTKAKRTLFKEIPLSELAASLKNADATFIALQRQPQAGELDQLQQSIGRTVHDLTSLNEDLPRMLALLVLLDEYIGVSNANMHLRASIGKTAHVLVSHPPEWRWTVAGDSSPWFPGFSIYRQDSNGSWDQAMERLATNVVPQRSQARRQQMI